MSSRPRQPELFSEAAEAGSQSTSVAAQAIDLLVTLDLVAGCFLFDWTHAGSAEPFARGVLAPTTLVEWTTFSLEWRLDVQGKSKPEQFDINHHGSSISAFVRRLAKRFPIANGAVRAQVIPPGDWGQVKAGTPCGLQIPRTLTFWKWLAGEVNALSKAVALERGFSGSDARVLRQRAALAFARSRLGPGPASEAPETFFSLRLTFDTIQGHAQFEWGDALTGAPAATGRVRCGAPDVLTWELEVAGRHEQDHSSAHRNSVRAALQQWVKRFPVTNATFTAWWIKPQPNSPKPLYVEELPFDPGESPWPWVEDNLVGMAKGAHLKFSTLGQLMNDFDPLAVLDFERFQRREIRREEKRAEEERRRREAMERMTEERRLREQRAAAARMAAEARKAAESKPHSPSPAAPPAVPARLPLPPVPIRVELPALAVQETAFPLTDLRGYFLRERAARWWVSNQSDDLLALPHCRIQRLEYQIRTALRVLGPMRGRALLSDEVGLGKTIEAGLVLKELLTRGMVKRFLVLTVPSLVDQWEEELNDKFNLTVVTTNHAGARSDAENFWRGSPGLVASLHTLKQPAQLEIARTVNWDLLIVDEAHYLRNRESQAWQAVNALPRQFLLLLTATPVQNSLEELYNLVTLLQPGQLPTPKEFRARFLDPQRPRQPREPEELRRLLGQVMIRNTRANAGLNLPPRRAETVLFEPEPDERVFWEQWETELRTELALLSASLATLWGRLLLQAAGSSPAAWRETLEKFPNPAAARAWRERAVLEASWKRKCDLLPPLTRGEGGVVIFTQFIRTQAALAESLRAAGVETFLINGGTPAEQRQPITEDFRRRGGALLLTHSGTEGRNLQFCHRLVNFDLPWNPMEIEQRIGRLHRLGQKHPVRIYNLVQAGTLQEHLLAILQEKLNLFELVVGETGLILGERYSSDEFAEEILRRWRESEGRVAESLASLGDELAAARDGYAEVKQLDATLFAKDYESL